MKAAILLFGAIGGTGVPIAFTLAGWMLRRAAPGDTGDGARRTRVAYARRTDWKSASAERRAVA